MANDTNFDMLKRESQKNKLSIVLFHGYGANSRDLFPLSDTIDPEKDYQWIFPNAPLPIDSFGYGRCWFPLPERGIENVDRALEKSAPQGLLDARIAMMHLIKETLVPGTKLIVGGFSQGALLALDIALEMRDEIEGLLLFSGTLVNQETTRERLKKCPPLNIFQSHGKHDDILPFSGAQKLKLLFEACNHHLSFHDFPGSHQIPHDVCHAARNFLHSRKHAQTTPPL